MNLREKTYRAFFWDLGGKLADQGIGFFISIILARLLAPEEFGLLAMVSVVISLASVFIDSGLGTALVQRKELTDAHYGSVFWFNIVTGSFLTLLFFLLSGVIADFYNHPELKPIMQVISFSFIIDAFTRVQAAWLTKQLKFEVLNKARIIALIISGTFGVTLAFMGYGIWALVVQSLVDGIVRNLYINFFSGWKPKLLYSFSALKDLWGFGLRIFLATLINTFTTRMDSLIIGKLFPANILGYYQRSKSLNDFVVKYTSGSLMSVVFPALSDIQNEEERYNNLVKKSYLIIAYLSVFLSALLLVLSDNLIIFLFGKKWEPSIIYFKLLLLSGFVYPISVLLVNILTSKGNSKAFLRLTIYKEILFVANLIIGFYFGVIQFLLGYTIVLYISIVLNIIYSAKEIKVSIGFFIKDLLIILAMNMVAFLFVYHIVAYLNFDNLVLLLSIKTLLFIIIGILLTMIFEKKIITLLLNELILPITKKIRNGKKNNT